MPAVYPDSFEVNVALGGRLLDLMAREQHIISFYPLSEQENDRARDIAFGRNHGTYVGTFTRGVTVDIPEGALGVTFDGTVYVEIPDDGEDGFVPPGFDAGRTLGFSGGSITIGFLIQTPTNDATERAIYQKCATDSSGNGPKVYLLNGAIGFALKVGGVSVFDFTRGNVADGQLHLVVVQYLPGDSAATIWIDGVQSGAAETGVSTLPVYVAANARIGMYNDDAGGFIGTLAYMMLSRQDETGVAATLQATRVWNDLASDILSVEPLRVRYGIRGSGILDNVASPGEMTFVLDNSEFNSAGLIGRYTPGHANQLAGFGVGAAVQFGITFGTTTYHKFRGRITGIRPTPGVDGERLCYVTCTDWIGAATTTFLSAMEVQINKRSDQVVKAVLDQMVGRTPPAVDIGVGSSTFLFAGDFGGGDQESVYTEQVRIATSERGFIYQRGDTTQGGTLVFEPRGTRQIATALDATFDNDMHGVEVTFGQEHIFNIVRVVVTPRRVDDTLQVLARLEISQQSIQIAPGKIYVFEGGYRDPNQEAARVGGRDLEPPDPGVDYAFWSDEAGTGTDLTANLAIRYELGGSSFRVEIENTGMDPGYLRLDDDTGFQIRGKGIYHYNPKTIERRNADSVRNFGPKAVQIDLQYETNLDVAEGVADFALSILSSERQIPTSLLINGNYSAERMEQALGLEVGQKIGIVEDMTALLIDDPASDGQFGYFINEVVLELGEAGQVNTAFTLAPSAPLGAGVFDESAFDEDLVFGV